MISSRSPALVALLAVLLFPFACSNPGTLTPRDGGSSLEGLLPGDAMGDVFVDQRRDHSVTDQNLFIDLDQRPADQNLFIDQRLDQRLADQRPADLPRNSVEVWRVKEIDLVASSSYANPFTDVEVNVSFVHEDGTTLVRPAFFYEGQRWKVRFAPTKEGLWRYTTHASNTTDSGLH
ncbi:MAG: DUF5060 domain-containing protein, partial [Deltaproteobacteria bacterium]|nr:DUF5060 domain-containing protein [Deltaproteobacteria bacterium]